METTWTIDKPITYPILKEDISADVAIIGGGICSLLCAYLLAKSDLKVVVLEAEKLGLGATAYTTAFLTCVIDTTLSMLTKIFGAKSAGDVWRSGVEAINLIEKIVEQEKIDCDFKRVPFILFSQTQSESQRLKKEESLARRLGFEALYKKDDGLGFKNEGYLLIPNQAKFHPLKFHSGLGQKSSGLGARIFEMSEVNRIIDSSTRGVTLITAKGKVNASNVIIATYKPFNGLMKFKTVRYSSYVLEALIPKGLIAEGTYADSKNPYHYFRIDDDGPSQSRMIVGGEDHRRDLPVSQRKSFKALEYFLNLVTPRYKILRKWKGTILESVDGLPFIGQYDPNHFVATGFSGNGMTYSAISAMIFKDILLGKPNDWKKVYSPTRRLTLKSLFWQGNHYASKFFGGALKNTLKF